MSTTLTRTVTRENLDEIVDVINAAHSGGYAVTVNGVAVYTRGCTRPASAWGTGSLSVSTKARTTNGTNDLWVKLGATVVVEVQS